MVIGTSTSVRDRECRALRGRSGGALIWLCAVAALATAARAQELEQPSFVEVIGEGLQQAAVEAGRMRGAALEANQDLEGKRRRYWQAFAAGAANRAELEAEFAGALIAKDLFYLTIFVPEGMDGARARMVGMITGGIDGGIRPAAYPAFVDWVTATRRALGAERPGQVVIVTPAALAAAAAPGNDRFQAYKRTRDRAEFEASGLDLRKFLDPQTYALQLLEGRAADDKIDPEFAKENPQVQATRAYRAIAGVIGEQKLLAAAGQVLAAPKNAQGDLARPVEAETPGWPVEPVTDPLRWFFALALDDDRGWALELLRDTASEYARSWEIAADKYRSEVQRRGELAVHRAAQRIRTAYKRSNGAIGADARPQKLLFSDLLANPALEFSGGPPPQLRVTDFAALRALDRKGLASVTATIRRVAPRQSGPFVELDLFFEGTERVSARVRTPEGFISRFGADASGLVGKSVEVTADVFAMNDGTVLLILYDPQQVKLVPS